MTEAAETPIAAGLARVRERIVRAAEAAGRDPASVRLIAVGKLQPLESLRAALDAGQRALGENYAQELRDKAEALAAHDPAPGSRMLGCQAAVRQDIVEAAHGHGHEHQRA